MSKNKFQIPNSKSQTKELWSLVIWSLVILCNLCIVYWNLPLYAQEQFTYDSKGKRDPFIPLVTPDGRLLKLEKEEAPSGLLIEGIIFDEHGSSYAIVNGEVVRVSDKIAGYQVLKIEENKVIFIREGQITELELKEDEP